MAKITGNGQAGDPFDEKWLSLNEAQIDFILEKYISEDPKRGRFIRPGGVSATPPQQYAAWERVLIGPAKVKFMSRFTLSPVVRARAEALRKAASFALRKKKPSKDVG